MFWRKGRAKCGLMAYFLAAAAPLPFAFGLDLAFKHQLGSGRVLYAGFLIAVLLALSRLWDSVALRAGASLPAERVRRILLLASGLVIALPLITCNAVGGTDARWYAQMLADFIGQLRSGVFPVFVGQSEFAFNGPVHPFRSAPAYLWLAGIWDLATFRSLSFVALQHLTGITACLVAATGMYAALTAAVRGNRWLAAGLALLYATCPVIIGTLQTKEMYMTAMAEAVLPLVVWANGGLFHRDDLQRYLALAAALVLTWMAHPPVALIASMATLLIQGGRLAAASQSWAVLGRAAVGAIGFCAFGAYYFWSMREIPMGSSPPILRDIPWVIGMGAGVVAVGRGLFQRRWKWLALLVVAAGLLADGYREWLWWFVWFGAIAGACAALPRALYARLFGGRGPALVFAAAILAVALAGRTLPWAATVQSAVTLGGLSGNPTMGTALTASFTGRYNGFDFEPGLVLWMLFGIALVSSIAARRATAQWLLIPVAGLVLFAIPLPGVTEFIAAHSPRGIAEVANLPLTLRIWPPAIACLVLGAHLALESLAGGRNWLRWAAAAAVVAGVLWSARNLVPVVRHGFAVTSNAALTAAWWNPTRTVMDHFVYDLLACPQYFSNGKMDPRLETRLLAPDRETVVIGPEQIAERMEKKGATKLALTARPFPHSDQWLKILPTITVPARTTLLLRFEFLPEEYRGTLIFAGSSGYREYALPCSGQVRAFGSAPGASRVISIENPLAEPETYQLELLVGPGLSGKLRNGDFGNVTVSQFEPERSPLRLRSLAPYVVETHLDRGGCLETPRSYVPGYRATIDGNPVALERSTQTLAMLAVPPGDHVVEIRFVGTKALWAGLAVSGFAWTLGLGFGLGRLISRRRRANSVPRCHPRAGGA